MGTIAEVHNDKSGIIWPKEVAPFDAHLIQIGNSNEINKQTKKVYNAFEKQGIEVLYDDREDKSPGEKFADADLIGIPLRIVISERTLAKNCVEIKKRSKTKTELVKLNLLNSYICKNS